MKFFVFLLFLLAATNATVTTITTNKDAYVYVNYADVGCANYGSEYVKSLWKDLT